ncbi:MAG: RHS repeat-associated core domain-containing protein [Hylemonella sp.]|nr:RHS repeat-associated core domain-containing protein [Hylemonella sp.]
MTAVSDAANRMTAITLNLGGTSKTYNLTYDANGNLVQKQNVADTSEQTLYVWDASDRLIRIEQSASGGANLLTASYGYDAFGRRIQNTLTQGGQTSTVLYLYEGAQALGEIRDGKLSHRLLTGLSLDETIARIAINSSGQKDAAGSRFYIADALQSVIAQLADDDSANLQNSYAYSPYGQSSTVGPDGTNNSTQYTSRENDATSLYFYRARYYDPGLKRFISSDPIGLWGGMNTYAYVSGNPVNYSDPLGLVDPTINVGFGFTFFNQFMNAGGSQGVNLSWSFQLNLATLEGSFQQSLTQLNGYGIFASAGFQGGLGVAAECSTPQGYSESNYGTWEAGVGTGLNSYGGGIQGNSDGLSVGSGVGRFGPGLGIYTATGVGVQKSYTWGGFPAKK